MPPAKSAAELELSRVEPMVDDGLPLVDLEARPAPADATRSTVRPFAFKFLTRFDDDPEFVRMTGQDVTYTFVNGSFKVDDL